MIAPYKNKNSVKGCKVSIKIPSMYIMPVVLFFYSFYAVSQPPNAEPPIVAPVVEETLFRISKTLPNGTQLSAYIRIELFEAEGQLYAYDELMYWRAYTLKTPGNVTHQLVSAPNHILLQTPIEEGVYTVVEGIEGRQLQLRVTTRNGEKVLELYARSGKRPRQLLLRRTVTVENGVTRQARFAVDRQTGVRTSSPFRNPGPSRFVRYSRGLLKVLMWVDIADKVLGGLAVTLADISAQPYSFIYPWRLFSENRPELPSEVIHKNLGTNPYGMGYYGIRKLSLPQYSQGEFQIVKRSDGHSAFFFIDRKGSLKVSVKGKRTLISDNVSDFLVETYKNGWWEVFYTKKTSLDLHHKYSFGGFKWGKEKVLFEPDEGRVSGIAVVKNRDGSPQLFFSVHRIEDPGIHIKPDQGYLYHMWQKKENEWSHAEQFLKNRSHPTVELGNFSISHFLVHRNADGRVEVIVFKKGYWPDDNQILNFWWDPKQRGWRGANMLIESDDIKGLRSINLSERTESGLPIVPYFVFETQDGKLHLAERRSNNVWKFPTFRSLERFLAKSKRRLLDMSKYKSTENLPVETTIAALTSTLLELKVRQKKNSDKRLTTLITKFEQEFKRWQSLGILIPYGLFPQSNCKVIHTKGSPATNIRKYRGRKIMVFHKSIEGIPSPVMGTLDNVFNVAQTEYLWIDSEMIPLHKVDHILLKE